MRKQFRESYVSRSRRPTGGALQYRRTAWTPILRSPPMLVRDAGALAARMRRAGLEVEHKTSVTDVVSAADRAAEGRRRAARRHRRPEDGMVGEEGPGATRRRRTWYVDPVDGTYNIRSGMPVWCSAVALVDGAGPLLGAVYQPITDELDRRSGGRGELNGGPVAPLEERALPTSRWPPTCIPRAGRRLACADRPAA